MSSSPKPSAVNLAVLESIDRQHRQVLKVAIELFGNRGYHATTMREVAIGARVSIGSLTRYAPTKEQLLLLALLHVLDGHLTAMRAALADARNAVERLHAALFAYCRAIDRSGDALLLIYREARMLHGERRDLVDRRAAETRELMRQCVKECVRRRASNEGQVAALADQAIMLCHGWALNFAGARNGVAVDAYAQRCLDLILAGASAGEPDRLIGKAS